jgi:hypothetical protein
MSGWHGGAEGHAGCPAGRWVLSRAPPGRFDLGHLVQVVRQVLRVLPGDLGDGLPCGDTEGGTDAFVGDTEELAKGRWVSPAGADKLTGNQIYEPVRTHLRRVTR